MSDWQSAADAQMLGVMRVLLVPLAAAAALALPAGPAFAADPVPGAHYEGTTDTGSPFSFDVTGDGTQIVNVASSTALSCVGPEPGVEIMALATTVPIAIAGGAFDGGDESTTPRLALKGTFPTAQEVTGTFEAITTKFKVGAGVTSCIRSGTFTARTATAPAAPPAPAGPEAQSGVSPGPTETKVTIGGPATLRLSKALKSGLALPLTLDGPATVTGTATLAAKDAKRYGVKRTFATATATRDAAGAFTLALKPKSAVARKLKKAKQLVVTVDVATGGNVASPSITRRKMTLA